MGACTAFIFAALIEFTVVNYLWRKQKLGYTLNQQGIDFSVSDNEEEAIELEQVSLYSRCLGFGSFIVKLCTRKGYFLFTWIFLTELSVVRTLFQAPSRHLQVCKIS